MFNKDYVVVGEQIVEENNAKIQKKNCSWRGHPISTQLLYGCSERRFGKNSTRKKCCTHIQTCHGINCNKHSRKCKWVGPINSTYFFQRCRWISLGTFSKRRRCCKFTKKCENETCKTVKNGCKWTTGSVRHGCVWKKIKKCIPKKNQRPYFNAAVKSKHNHKHQNTLTVETKKKFNFGTFIKTEKFANNILTSFLGVSKHPKCAIACVQNCPRNLECYRKCETLKKTKRALKACGLSCGLNCIKTCGTTDKCASSHIEAHKNYFIKRTTRIEKRLSKTHAGKKLLKKGILAIKPKVKPKKNQQQQKKFLHVKILIYKEHFSVKVMEIL